MAKEDVQKIVNRNTLAKTFGEGDDARTYRIRRFDALVSMMLHGSKAFGLLSSARSAEERLKVVGEMSHEERLDMIRRGLKIVMVSPRLAERGSPSDPDADVIAFEDMGDDALNLYSFMLATGGDEPGFRKSSATPDQDG